MKVLHISKFYPPYNGGIEDICHTVVNLLKSSATQKVFCFNDSPETKTGTYEEIEIIRVAVQKSIASQPLALTYRNELQKTITAFSPDVIHFHAPNPFAAQMLLKCIPSGTRLVVHWHSDIIEQKLLYRFIKGLESRLLQRANYIIATSPNYLEHSRPLSPFRYKCIVIQNVIDKQKFEITPDIQMQIASIKHRFCGKPIVLFVGRHIPYKGIGKLIEAEKYIKADCNILIAGSGPLSAKLQAQARGSRRIHFLGKIPGNMLSTYYYAADVFAFPSVTKNEAFGVALAEAMYCGAVPVTFTIQGSGANWVNIGGETGLEAENGNAKAFATAIDTLLGDPVLRANMARRSRQRVLDVFTEDCIKTKIMNVLQIHDTPYGR